MYNGDLFSFGEGIKIMLFEENRFNQGNKLDLEKLILYVFFFMRYVYLYLCMKVEG